MCRFASIIFITGEAGIWYFYDWKLALFVFLIDWAFAINVSVIISKGNPTTP